MATATGSAIRIWDADTGKQLAQLSQEAAAIDFSSDGRWIASASGNKVSVWDVSTGKELARLLHGEPPRRDYYLPPPHVVDVLFSPDGKRLATEAGDKVWVWIWQRDELIDEACSRLERNLTPEEWSLFF